MTIGSQITAAGFKAIQDKAESLLGTGASTRGYGQTVLSVDYAPGTRILKSHWDALRYDIINIRLHQDGVNPAAIQVNVGDLIRFGAGAPNTNYNSLLETAIANRFNLGPGQSMVSAIDAKTFTSSWTTSATSTLTATFSTSDQARYFFNSGGKIRVTSTRVGGSSSSQNNAWTNLLNAAGIQEFGAITSTSVNFYTLTNSYQTYYQSSSTTPYSANNYRLEAKCNVSNNSSGTATAVDIRAVLTDSYVDPGNSGLGDTPNTVDLVNGTLTLTFEELKAAGALAPSGSFVITSPSYSVSSIAAS